MTSVRTCRTVVDAQHLHRGLVSGTSEEFQLDASSAPPPAGAEGVSLCGQGVAVTATALSNAAHQTDKPVNEVFNQIAFADIVLLNKIDLVSDEAAVEVERAVREINSLARVVHTRLNDDDYPNWLNTVGTIVCPVCLLAQEHLA